MPNRDAVGILLVVTGALAVKVWARSPVGVMITPIPTTRTQASRRSVASRAPESRR